MTRLSAVLLLFAASPLSAQLSVGVSGATVRYEGLSSTSSIGASPDLLIARPRVLFDVNAYAASATDGTRLIQGGSRFWGMTPPVVGPLQFTGLVEAQGIKPQGDVASSEVQGFGEAALAGDRGGVAVGLGGAQGTLGGQPSVTAFRAGARAWLAAVQGVLVAAAVEPTHLSGSWFTDYLVRAEIDQGRLAILGGLTLRNASGVPVSAGVDGSLAWHSTERLAVEASGGHYLPDPYQGLAAGWFLTAGLRVTLWTPENAGAAREAGQASLTQLNLAGQAAQKRLAPAVTKAPSGTGTGRHHRP
jgi:hypothetical protein